MSSNFVLRGYTRRIAWSVVDAMVPRWPEFDVELTDDVLEQVESMVRSYPAGIRVGVIASLYGVEFAGPILGGGGLKPTSWLPRDEAYRRLDRIANAPIPQVRMLILLFKILISLSAYSREDVEEFLGVPRRAWRADRRRFRSLLVQIDARGSAPPVPEPLGSAGVSTADDYLDFGAGARLRVVGLAG